MGVAILVARFWAAGILVPQLVWLTEVRVVAKKSEGPGRPGPVNTMMKTHVTFKYVCVCFVCILQVF